MNVPRLKRKCGMYVLETDYCIMEFNDRDDALDQRKNWMGDNYL